MLQLIYTTLFLLRADKADPHSIVSLFHNRNSSSWLDWLIALSLHSRHSYSHVKNRSSPTPSITWGLEAGSDIRQVKRSPSPFGGYRSTHDARRDIDERVELKPRIDYRNFVDRLSSTDCPPIDQDHWGSKPNEQSEADWRWEGQGDRKSTRLNSSHAD